MSEPTRRSGMRIVHAAKPGSRMMFFGGRIIVVHPDDPPCVVEPDGSVRVIEITGPPPPARFTREDFDGA